MLFISNKVSSFLSFILILALFSLSYNFVEACYKINSKVYCKNPFTLKLFSQKEHKPFSKNGFIAEPV